MNRILIALLATCTSAAIVQAAEPTKDDKPKWDVSADHGPAKDVPIDTRSGTWMSVDVSPDGREIAFDLLGDIYVMPIGGGEARAILTGPAWEMQPRWSPDGRSIAFTSDRGGGNNIWIVDKDGKNPVQVTKEDFRLLNQPEWTPDGDYIVARKHFTGTRSLGAGEMWLYHRSGGGGVQLTKKRTDQKDTNEPAFSPDGRYLYYSDDVTPGDTFEYSKDVNGEIYAIQRLDRQTGKIEKYVGGPGGSIRPTPSPDGKTLAFIRRDRYKSTIYLLDIATGRETPITDILDRDMQETWAVEGVYPGMSWTPDSRSIVFWAQGGIKRIDVASKSVSDVPFHVTGTRRITEAVRHKVDVAPRSFDVKMIRFAKTSPDGKRVVFEALGHLWIRDVSGGTPKRLTTNDQFELYPSWSRDGRQIAYVSWSDDEQGAVRVVPATGGSGRKVTTVAGNYLEPAFSPDGKTIAFTKVQDGYLTSPVNGREPGIYLGPAAGGATKRIADSGSEPQFGASNDRVFYVDDEDKKRVLKSVGIDRSEPQTHLASEFAADFAISPDEKWVAWTERFQARVMPFARTGKAIDVSADMKSLPVFQVTRDAGNWIHWSGDSHKLWWSLGPELYGRETREDFTFVAGAPAKLPPVAEKGISLSFAMPYDAPIGRVAFTNARIITMRGGNEVIDKGTILLDGNRIEAVGANVSVPAGTRVIDASGKTIIPGLIDGHWHGSMGADQIIPQQSWINFAGLAFGVTTIHDPSNDTSEIFAASELEKAGLITGPRIFSTGTILYGATTPFTAKVDSLDDALGHLRRLQAAGAWSVKSYNQPRREQRQQIIAAARQLDMSVVPEGGSLFEMNMTMIADGHTTIEHSLPVAHVYDDVLQYWKGSGTAYNPTLIVAYGGPFGENYWYQHTNVWADPILSRWVPRRALDSRARRPVMVPDEENNVIEVSKTAKRIGDLGIPVTIGAHGQRQGLGAHWDMWMFVLGGMSPIQALATGTINPARAYGMEKDLGTLEPGKLADLVVLDANPLDNIRNTTSIRYTVANGRVYDSNMDEVGTRMRKRKPFWFEQPGNSAWTDRAAAEAIGHVD